MQLNDVHSQFNPTVVAEVVRPKDLPELVKIIRRQSEAGGVISIAGGRHAMGGQQFAEKSVHIDTTALDRVLEMDNERGLLTVEAGIMWPAIIRATRNMKSADGTPWAIRQKQTGVDDVTLGGTMAANGHGRGLRMQPIVDDIERFTIVTATGELVMCDREQNAELFSLAIGGYGLFGVIFSATLRLSPRLVLKRIVDIIDIDDARHAIYRRIDEGCLYGDFQYAIDSAADTFMRRGVFACYKPVTTGETPSGKEADLPKESWLELLRLAHENKAKAFDLYAQHYLQSSGTLYWSDDMQLSTYIPSYADYLLSNAAERPVAKETLMIGEHYVPYDAMLTYIVAARRTLRKYSTEVIYGTIRVIREDKHTFLPWAKENYGCVIFNLRMPHSEDGVRRIAETFRSLIDDALALGGSFFLTYHRFATKEQMLAAYPRLPEFLKKKEAYDPQGLFQSEWYRHICRTLG